MPNKCTRWLVGAYNRLSGRPSYMLLTGGDERLAIAAPGRFRNAWAGLLALSLAYGAAGACVWGLAWGAFGDRDIMFMPTVAATAFMCLWLFRRAIVATAEVLGGPNPTARAVAGSVLLAVLVLCLLSMRTDHYHHEEALPIWLAWSRPSVELYRVLVLAPLWGGWSMLLLVQFVRPNDRTEQAVAAFARGCGPILTTACMVLPAALTCWYFHFVGVWALGMWGVAVATAAIVGPVLAARTGGLRRDSLLATNFLTQMAFTLAYLANR